MNILKGEQVKNDTIKYVINSEDNKLVEGFGEKAKQILMVLNEKQTKGIVFIFFLKCFIQLWIV